MLGGTRHPRRQEPGLWKSSGWMRSRPAKAVRPTGSLGSSPRASASSRRNGQTLRCKRRASGFDSHRRLSCPSSPTGRGTALRTQPVRVRIPGGVLSVAGRKAMLPALTRDDPGSNPGRRTGRCCGRDHPSSPLCPSSSVRQSYRLVSGGFSVRSRGAALGIQRTIQSQTHP